MHGIKAQRKTVGLRDAFTCSQTIKWQVGWKKDSHSATHAVSIKVVSSSGTFGVVLLVNGRESVWRHLANDRSNRQLKISLLECRTFSILALSNSVAVVRFNLKRPVHLPDSRRHPRCAFKR